MDRPVKGKNREKRPSVLCMYCLIPSVPSSGAGTTMAPIWGNRGPQSLMSMPRATQVSDVGSLALQTCAGDPSSALPNGGASAGVSYYSDYQQ